MFSNLMLVHITASYSLRSRTSKYGDGAPEAAVLYFSYGKALLENAIAQTAVLGKEQAEEALAKPEPEEGNAYCCTAYSIVLLVLTHQ